MIITANVPPEIAERLKWCSNRSATVAKALQLYFTARDPDLWKNHELLQRAAIASQVPLEEILKIVKISKNQVLTFLKLAKIGTLTKSMWLTEKTQLVFTENDILTDRLPEILKILENQTKPNQKG